MKDGLRIESAASVTARDMFRQHMATFAHVVHRDRTAGQSTATAYIDGLASVAALIIAGGHGSREDVIEATIAKLREAVDRDLRFLGSK